MGKTFSGFCARLAVLLPTGLFGCVSATDTDRSALTIFAAASLTGDTGDLDQVVTATHPRVNVTSPLYRSATLKTRIKEGGPAE